MSGFENGKALIIAISDYKEIGALPGAVINDALDIAEVLCSSEYCGYSPKNVTVLTNEEATLAAIRAGLANIALRCDENDTVVVFFSGHGGRFEIDGRQVSGLLPVDTSIEQPENTSLLECEFSELLSKIPAKRLLVLVDACHSGGVGSFKSPKDYPLLKLGIYESTFARLASGTGRVLIGSSRADETSIVMRGARNSVFTQHLIEALKGNCGSKGDGLIRVFELFEHVSQGVRVSVPHDQNPVFKASDLEDNFPVALLLGGMKGNTISSIQNERFPENLSLDEVLASLYPTGPTDQDIWVRAGGDVSRLRLHGNGRSNWHAALRSLSQGGGGRGISLLTLLREVYNEFPNHSAIQAHLSKLKEI